MKNIVDIKGEIEGDYEIIGKYEERPQGEWIFNTSFWSCSVCKKPAKTIGYCGDEEFMNEFFKFCPNCGADMKGGAE